MTGCALKRVKVADELQGGEESRSALAAVVTHFLLRRFKRIPAKFQRTLAWADFDTLVHWLERSKDAASLEDLFRSTRPP